MHWIPWAAQSSCLQIKRTQKQVRDTCLRRDDDDGEFENEEEEEEDGRKLK